MPDFNMGTVLHHLVKPCQTLVVWAVVVSVVPMVMSSAITASCCQLCATWSRSRVMCPTLSQERLQLHPVIFVPGPANIQHSLTDNGSGTGKSEAASAGGMFSVQCPVFAA